MPRTTSTNTFEGGMIKDIHPIMVPKNVVTDCLNGTLITYNGNEFALQNDMGNYKFKEGSLSEGFVPVGMKEYGGILYIVSYNPIDNQVEVGSFPSQKTIFNSNVDDTSNTTSPIELPNTYNLYSELIQNSKIVVLSKDKNFFLNPGDKYILQTDESSEDLDKLKSWQRLNPFILTDDNKLYDINGYINLIANSNTSASSDYKSISWEVPGWLAVQWMLNVMDEFDAYFEAGNINATNNGDGSYTVIPTGVLKIQSFWNKNIYGELIENDIKNQLVYFLCNSVDDIFNGDARLVDTTNSHLNFNSINSIIYNSVEELDNYKYIIPALKVDDKYIVYDQFKTSIDREEQTIYLDQITFGEDVFKYYVSENSVTFDFDVNAYPGLKLKYQLYRYVDPCQYVIATENETQDELVDSKNYAINTDSLTKIPVFKNWQDFENLNYSGENILDIEYTTISEYTKLKYLSKIPNNSKYNYYTGTVNTNGFYDYNLNKTFNYASNTILQIANTFDKEDIYELSVRFVIEDGSNEVILKEFGYTPNASTEWSLPICITDDINTYYYSTEHFDELPVIDIIRRSLENITFDFNDGEEEWKVDITNVDGQTNTFYNKDVLNSLFYDNNNLRLENVREYLGSKLIDVQEESISSGTQASITETYSRDVLETLKPNFKHNQYDVIGRMWINANLLDHSDTVLTDKNGIISFGSKAVSNIEYKIYTAGQTTMTLMSPTEVINMWDLLNSEYTEVVLDKMNDESDAIGLKGFLQYTKLRGKTTPFDGYEYASSPVGGSSIVKKYGSNNWLYFNFHDNNLRLYDNNKELLTTININSLSIDELKKHFDMNEYNGNDSGIDKIKDTDESKNTDLSKATTTLNKKLTGLQLCRIKNNRNGVVVNASVPNYPTCSHGIIEFAESSTHGKINGALYDYNYERLKKYNPDVTGTAKSVINYWCVILRNSNKSIVPVIMYPIMDYGVYCRTEQWKCVNDQSTFAATIFMYMIMLWYLKISKYSEAKNWYVCNLLDSIPNTLSFHRNISKATFDGRFKYCYNVYDLEIINKDELEVSNEIEINKSYKYDSKLHDSFNTLYTNIRNELEKSRIELLQRPNIQTGEVYTNGSTSDIDNIIDLKGLIKSLEYSDGSLMCKESDALRNMSIYQGSNTTMIIAKEYYKTLLNIT